MRIDVSNMARSIYRSRMDTTRCTNPVIVDWYLTREKWEFGKSEKKKKKYDEVNDRNGLEKSWQIGNMIGNGISEIGLLASSI